MFPYFMILFQAHPMTPVHFSCHPHIPTSQSLVTFSPTRMVFPTQSTLPTGPQINLSYHLGISVISSSPPYIPHSIASISKSPTPAKWTLALSNDIHSLISQKKIDTSPVDVNSIPSHQIVPSKVIFDIRMNADGSINKYKARLVAQDNYQDDSTFLTHLLMWLLIKASTYYSVSPHQNSFSYQVSISKQHSYIHPSKKYYISIALMVLTHHSCLPSLNFKNVSMV